MSVVMYGEQSEHLNELFAALSAFQGEITNVERTRDGEFGLYADLADVWKCVRKSLAVHGLSITQPVLPFGSDGALACVTCLAHKSGQYMKQAIPLTPGLSLQALAGEITYARRIAMSAALGLAADWDDDGTQSKANHEEYISETDRKYTQAAVQKLMEAEDDEAVLVIYEKIDAYHKSGKISEGSVRKLESDFPRPKTKAPKKEEEMANA